MVEKKPIVAVTMGDPAGIGPEVACKALASRGVRMVCRPLLIGDSDSLTEALKISKLSLRLNMVQEPSQARFQRGVIDIINMGNVDHEQLEVGRPQASAGKASIEYVEKAVSFALKGEVDAVATAPISKEAIWMAGYRYPGHTELLAQLTNTREYAMMLYSKKLKVVHVSTHVSLRQAIDLVKKPRIRVAIRLSHQALRSMGYSNPRIAVAGLNPHAGESGIFGDEEIEEISPAVAEAREEGFETYGPFPPDTVFYRALRGEFDCVVAMYHDQGHIPVKSLGFQKGVNVTLGLPIIRTSVDHGTAWDKAAARLGNADPGSMIEAIKLAAKMAQSKWKPTT
ncbi:MAG: 4-hydroxythreonine-4-phosphate dehydrogenase PdxA [Candidatus Bathyarchaeia archaeon]